MSSVGSSLMPGAHRDALDAAARKVADAGLTPGSSGNVSVRTSRGFLVTPTGASLSDVRAHELVECRADGEQTRSHGPIRTSEWRIHRDIYAARSDVGAVVHTHSRFATVFSCLRRELSAVHYMIAVSGAAQVRCAEYATFGTEALSRAALAALGSSRACLLANHGLVAVGATLTEAIRVAVELENLAALEWHARALGPPVVLDAKEISAVSEKFSSYGREAP